ncbi:MAG: FecR domain-containing protein [Parasphingorhabdus sp.]|nr:FecR domain-containing protein [Parasphingorhabdus sp.]
MSDGMALQVEEQAIDWMIRQRDPAFDDWQDFAAWLDLSPDHAAVYDRIASLDTDLAHLSAPAEEIAVPKSPLLASRRTWIGGAMAAMLVGAISFSLFGSDSTRIETDAGEQRSVALADGSRIEINGGTVIELDEDRPRFARLESGEAMFHVIHRAGDPFTVEAGEARLVDLGTSFNVVRRRKTLNVAVSEGLVAYNPERENLHIKAGYGIEAGAGGGRPKVQAVDPLSIGGWRKGQLVYNGASIEQVAEDLGRTAGLSIAVSPDVAALPFRGALLVSDDKQRVIDDLTSLAGIRAEKQTEGWLLTR